MTNVRYELEEYRDIELRNMAKERLAAGYSMESVMASIYAKGRDNARTPMQWDDSDNAGFTAGKPWLKVNPNYKEINVASQLDDPDSILNYYRHLIALRKREDVIREGDYRELMAQREDIIAYERTMEGRKLTVLANFTDREISLCADLMAEAGQLELSNYPDAPQAGTLRPYEAVIYLK